MSKLDELMKKTAGISARSLDKPAENQDTKNVRSAPAQFMLAHVQQQVQEAEEKAAKLQKLVDEMPLKELEISKLLKVPGRQRKLKPDEYAALKENLSKQPLLNPVLVTALDDTDLFNIVAGHNRVDIYEDLGRPTILCRIIESTQVQQEFLSFFENLFQSSLPPYSKFAKLKQLREFTGQSIREMAESLKLSKSHIADILNFDRLPKEALRFLEENPHCLQVKAAIQLVKANEAGHHERVVQAIEKLATDPEFTERMAIEYALGETVPGKPARKPKASQRTVALGSEQYCAIDVRGARVSVDFSHKKEAAQWVERFEQFMKETLAKTGSTKTDD